MKTKDSLVASFGLKIADPTIDWPKEAERDLVHRAGWTAGTMNARVPATGPQRCCAESSPYIG